MRRLVALLCFALLAPIAAMAQALAPPAPVLCITSPPTNCSSLTHVGSGSQGEQAYHFLGKLNDWGLQLGLFSNQPANEIEATPNGASGLPSLRQLVSADFPVPLSLIGVYTGVIQSWNSSGGTINGTLDLSFDVNGNAFLLGNAGLYLASSGSGSLNLETSNVDRMFINSTGNIGINAPSVGVALAVTAQGTSFAETYGATGNATNGAGGIGFDSSGSMYLESTVGALNVGTTTATGFNILTKGLARSDISSAGDFVINVPDSGVALTVNGTSGQFAALFQGNTGTGTSAGPRINAGTNSSDDAFQVANAAGTTNYFNISGDGGIVAGAATGGDKGVGTINMTGCYVNGVACGGGSATEVNGASVPASAAFTATNSSSQFTSMTAAQAQAALIAANAVTYTPTLGSGATNDWDPSGGTGITTVGFVNATPNSSGSTVDGIAAGSDKQQFVLCNAAALPSTPFAATTNFIILENQSSSDSTAVNRLAMAGNVVLGPQMCATFTYVAGSIDRWLVSPIANGGTPPTDPLAAGTSMTPDCSFSRNTITVSTGTAITVNAPTDCTAAEGQKLELDITSASGGAATYTWNGTYLASATLAIPTTANAASKQDRFLYAWSALRTGWVLLAYNQGF